MENISDTAPTYQNFESCLNICDILLSSDVIFYSIN